MAGIWPSDVPALGHQDTPFQERTLCTVTANTREDGQEFLTLAERFGIRPQVATYPMANAPTALTDLAPTAGSAAPPSSASAEAQRRLPPRDD